MSAYDDLSLDELQELASAEPVCESGQGQTNAVIMYRMCEALGVIAFRAVDVDGVFVRFPLCGHSEIAGVRSRRFQAWLTDKFFTDQQVEPKKADIEGSVLLLEALAHKNPKRKTHTRMARLDERIYVDLCNDRYQVVEVDANGWHIVEDSPAWFMRSSSMQALPEPTEGGSLLEFREFVNLDDEDFTLLMGWVVTTMNPDGPFPLLAISSEQGSGKSTLTTLLKKLIDPDAVPKLGKFKEANDLFAAACARWVVALDNQTKIGEDFSDALCRLATGGGNSKRALYTDNDPFSCSVMRPVILNGIAPSLGKLDLLDRTYPIKLSPISQGKRRMEAELYAAFEKVRPKIFGALLTAVSCALKERNYIPTSLPRMADGAAFAMQAEKGGGFPWPEGRFAEVLNRKEAEKRDEAILNDPVASRIVPLAEGYGWSGTMQELLHEILQGVHFDERKFLPGAANGLARKLVEIAPLLREKGIHWEGKRTNGTKIVRIWRAPESTGVFSFLDLGSAG